MAGGVGGRRKGAGRKPHDPPLQPTMIRLTAAQMKLLRTWGKGDMAAGLRWLIDAALPLIIKADRDQPLEEEKKKGD